VVSPDAVNTMRGQNISAHFLYPSGSLFPDLAWSEFRIEELINKRCFRVLLGQICGLRFRNGLSYGMEQGFRKRQPLDALCTPCGVDAAARDTPDFLGIGLKKCLIELSPEAVDEKLLESVLLFEWEKGALHIAQPNADGPPESELYQRGFIEADGVLEQ